MYLVSLTDFARADIITNLVNERDWDQDHGMHSLTLDYHYFCIKICDCITLVFTRDGVTSEELSSDSPRSSSVANIICK